MGRAHQGTRLLPLLCIAASAQAQNAILPAPAPSLVKPQGVVQPARLKKKVQPIKPTEAKRLEVQGLVKLTVGIDAEGKVHAVEVASGTPLLVESAVEATKQWEYDPCLIDGKPSAVWTQVTFTFLLTAPHRNGVARRK